MLPEVRRSQNGNRGIIPRRKAFPMAEMFALFYVVFFGAFLSVEIATPQFRPDDPGSNWWIWILRVLCLVAARSVYLAGAFVAIRPAKLPPDGWEAFGYLLLLLFLCTPVLGFQQLSYILVSGARCSWCLMTILFLALPVLALFFWWYCCLRKLGA